MLGVVVNTTKSLPPWVSWEQTVSKPSDTGQVGDERSRGAIADKGSEVLSDAWAETLVREGWRALGKESFRSWEHGVQRAEAAVCRAWERARGWYGGEQREQVQSSLKSPRRVLFFKIIFYVNHFLNLYWVYYNIACFMFCSFGHEPCEILVSYQGSNPYLLHWKVKSSSLDHQGSFTIHTWIYKTKGFFPMTNVFKWPFYSLVIKICR